MKYRIINAAAKGTNGAIQLLKANARDYRNFARYRTATAKSLISIPQAVPYGSSATQPT